MIDRHLCLADTTIRLGLCWDCPKCWTALEQSVELARSEGTFRGDEPPEQPVHPQLPVSPYDPPPPDPCPPSSVDPNTCAYCGRQDRLCTFCRHRPPVDPS